MKRALLAAWAALLLVAGCTAQQPASSPSFRISGVVVNALSGEPLPRTEVQIGRSLEQRQLLSTITGVDGRFSFDGLAPGKYWLSAQRRGFPRQAFEQHGNFFTAIAVGPNLESENLVFRVRPHASISGTILDEAGEAVRDANVMLFRSGVESGRRGIAMRDQTQTDDRGMYHFGNLHPGTYYIAVSARPWYAQYPSGPTAQEVTVRGPYTTYSVQRGRPPQEINPALDVAYPVTYYSGATDASGAMPIILKMGERATADLNLIPVPAVHLRISIPDQKSDGQNPAKAQAQTVILSQQIFGNYTSPVFSQQTQVAPGELEISGIPPGRFDMKLQSFGRTPTLREGQVEVAGDAQVDAPASPSTPVTISGKVQLNGGTPPGRGFIRIWKRSSGRGLGGRISKTGEFELHQDRIDPGRYEVGVFGLRGAVVRRINATGANVVGQSLDIQDGGAVRLNVELAEGLGEISGTVLRDGKALSGAMVVLVPPDFENNASLIRRDQSDSDGTFTLRAVLPGRYTVLALDNAWDMEWLNPSWLTQYLSGGTPLEVAARQKYEIKVKAQ